MIHEGDSPLAVVGGGGSGILVTKPNPFGITASEIFAR